MKSVKMTCSVFLAGLTCVALAMVGTAPGQAEPPPTPSTGTRVEPAGPVYVPQPAVPPAANAATPTLPPGASATEVVPSDAARALRAVFEPKSEALGGSFRGAGGGGSGYVQPRSDYARLRIVSSDGSPYPPLPVDPELAKLMGEAHKAEAEQGQLLTKYAKTTDPKERAEIKDALAKVLQRLFDLQQQQREREVAEIEARVKKLREMITNRNAARQTIVSSRRDQLLNEIDGMGWVSPAGASSGAAAYSDTRRYPSALGEWLQTGPSPVPASPAGNTLRPQEPLPKAEPRAR